MHLQEKFEHLKEMVKLETGMDCTFSPQISSRGAKASKSDKPAFYRLYERGQQYRQAKEERLKVTDMSCRDSWTPVVIHATCLLTENGIMRLRR